MKDESRIKPFPETVEQVSDWEEKNKTIGNPDINFPIEEMFTDLKKRMQQVEGKIKSQFIAQHLGQKVLMHIDWESFNDKSLGVVQPCYLEQGNRLKGFYLLLRSINQLTNEEKITIANLVCARHNRHYQPGEVTYKISNKRAFDVIVIVKKIARHMVQLDSDGVGFVDYYMGGAGSTHHYAPGQYNVTDYYRSIGVLIPFTYLDETNKPVTIQPAEILQRGWVKLKNDGK